MLQPHLSFSPLFFLLSLWKITLMEGKNGFFSPTFSLFFFFPLITLIYQDSKALFASCQVEYFQPSLQLIELLPKKKKKILLWGCSQAITSPWTKEKNKKNPQNNSKSMEKKRWEDAGMGGDLQLNEEGKKWSQKWDFLREQVGREKAAGGKMGIFGCKLR